MSDKKKTRELKVYGQSGHKYQDTPTIVLKGKWLEDAGFRIGKKFTVYQDNGTIILNIIKMEEQ